MLQFLSQPQSRPQTKPCKNTIGNDLCNIAINNGLLNCLEAYLQSSFREFQVRLIGWFGKGLHIICDQEPGRIDLDSSNIEQKLIVKTEAQHPASQRCHELWVR